MNKLRLLTPGGVDAVDHDLDLLFGILAMVFRFVPYLGAFIAAIFPIAVAVAVDPGWSMALMTTALFLVVEPLIGQVIEPIGLRP